MTRTPARTYAGNAMIQAGRCDVLPVNVYEKVAAGQGDGHGRDVSAGEVSLLCGARVVVVHDRALATRLLHAAQ